MRVLLEVYADDGHLHGSLRVVNDADPVPFDGVLELLAALEYLDPDPLTDRAPQQKGDAQP